jgi:integrase
MGRSKASFGSVRRLPSGRWQARYTGPDLVRHTAPLTFDTRGDAETWLAMRRSEVARGVWRPPGSTRRPFTFGEYAAGWLADRDLKPRTRELYRSLLDRRILPTFADTPLTALTPSQVRRWHADQGAATPTARTHAYGLLKGILATAVADEHLAANPCRIRGAGTVRRVHKIRPATLAELEVLVAAMPERYRLMALLASWCGLRFGELVELRRRDVDLTNGVLRVRRAVVHVSGHTIVGTPKSDAGTRDVAIPPHLMPMVREHLRTTITGGRDGLLFPAADGKHLAPSTLYRSFHAARTAAGRPDLRFHDLRHTGAVLAASTGATLAELMGRLGHSTPGAALRYQHAAEGRDQAIARALSALADAGTP